jgi:hypothetical protein
MAAGVVKDQFIFKFVILKLKNRFEGSEGKGQLVFN